MIDHKIYAALDAIAKGGLTAEQCSDLAKAALSEFPEQKVDVCAQMRLMCSSCGGTGNVVSPTGEDQGTCNCSYAQPTVSGEHIVPGGFVASLPAKWEATAHRFAKRGTSISLAEAASMSNDATQLREAIAADRLAAQTKPESDDAIARCKLILKLVDAYVDTPTSATRTELRIALMQQFERHLTGQQLYDVAKSTGLWAHLQDIGATAARQVLTEFATALPAHLSLPPLKPSVPEGYALVPVVPDANMEEAGDAAYAEWENGHCVLAVWDAMIKEVQTK